MCKLCVKLGIGSFLNKKGGIATKPKKQEKKDESRDKEKQVVNKKGKRK